jgi:hypothetical protein
MISWRSWGSETVLIGLFLCTWYRILEVDSESTHVRPAYEMDLAVDHSVHAFFYGRSLRWLAEKKVNLGAVSLFILLMTMCTLTESANLPI